MFLRTSIGFDILASSFACRSWPGWNGSTTSKHRSIDWTVKLSPKNCQSAVYSSPTRISEHVPSTGSSAASKPVKLNFDRSLTISSGRISP